MNGLVLTCDVTLDKGYSLPCNWCNSGNDSHGLIILLATLSDLALFNNFVDQY